MAILNNVSGVLKPGRTTLLLGPPAAGKSTLLKALAGKLQHGSLKVCEAAKLNEKLCDNVAMSCKASMIQHACTDDSFRVNCLWDQPSGEGVERICQCFFDPPLPYYYLYGSAYRLLRMGTRYVRQHDVKVCSL